MAEGIEVRHRTDCQAHEGGRCYCSPAYRASVYDKRAGKLVRRTFPTLAAARSWRADANGVVRRGHLSADRAPTLREAADLWVRGASEGTIRNRSGLVYKPSAVAGYRTQLRDRLVPAFGALRLDEIERRHLQYFVEQLLRQGLDPSAVRNALMPLRAIYRRALVQDLVQNNPTRGLELPAVTGRRDRIASPGEAERLLAALPERDRPIWATALYAGLRAGELQALAVEHVDFDRGLIHVERSWDRRHRTFVTPKFAGVRRVPLIAPLREIYLSHLPTSQPVGLILSGTRALPFEITTLRNRALTAWRREGLSPITLHECRHTYASLMIASGVNAKALSTFMGHASVTITYDRYGHLMPGSEIEAATLV